MNSIRSRFPPISSTQKPTHTHELHTIFRHEIVDLERSSIHELLAADIGFCQRKAGRLFVQEEGVSVWC